MEIADPALTSFESERRRLRAIATRIVQSADEADDVLQEAWLRFSRTDAIEDPPAWLTAVVTRLCLDHLRKRETRLHAETAIDGHEVHALANVEPDEAVHLTERVDDAMHVVLETLTPAERVTFVLHDVFAFPFDDIGAVLGRSSTAVRQMASRARRKARRSPESVEEQTASIEHREVVEAFLTAARGGELATLITLLAPNAVMQADLIGQKMGTDACYDGAVAVAARLNGAKGAMPATIDGELGAAWFQAGTVKVAFVFHVDGGVVHEVELIADPEALAAIRVIRRHPLPRSEGSVRS